MSEIFRHSFALKVRKGSLGEFLKDLGCKKKELGAQFTSFFQCGTVEHRT